MKFSIEQIAIAPTNPKKAMELLKAMGAVDWLSDIVVGVGGNDLVSPQEYTNVAELNFNYQLGSDSFIEFEILDYKAGLNWVDQNEIRDSVCHLGMHCDASELAKWRKFFAERGITIAQQVNTVSHTNEALRDSRRYNYVIFNTKAILGVDLKFIVRKNITK